MNTIGKYGTNKGAGRNRHAVERDRASRQRRAVALSGPAAKQGGVAAALMLALLVLTPQFLLASPGEGRSAYLRYCAACHGEDATGRGPLRNAFRSPPADLTTLTIQRGKFPAEELFAVMEQSQSVAAHGSRATPVWGESFWRVAGETDFDRSPESRTMKDIIDFIESLQGSSPISNR